MWGSHFATCLTRPDLNSKTTGAVIHPEADRPLTVREMARVQVRWAGRHAMCISACRWPPPAGNCSGVQFIAGRPKGATL